jgi:hypothetical protein
MKKSVWAAVAVAALIPLCGCPFNFGGGSDTEFLDGTWEITGAAVASDVTNFLVTFNSSGDITEVQYTFGDSTITIQGNAIAGDADVDGSDVTITLQFDGTVNDDQNVMTGNLSYSIVIGAVTIESPPAAATLTKQ